MLTAREAGDSFFQPYFDVLPADFDNFPIFWGEDLLAKLEGSVLVQQIRERKVGRKERRGWAGVGGGWGRAGDGRRMGVGGE